jgi:hypothetical protein
LDLDLPEDPDDDNAFNDASNTSNPWSIPEAAHWQAAHPPKTGNQYYGNAINFKKGLTDAGLQEYHRVSKMWHRLIRPKRSISILNPRKHARAYSNVIGTSLIKRMDIRNKPLRHFYQWDMAEVEEILRQFYGPEATWRSANQKLAMQQVVKGTSQVIAILATSEGKSLLYQLPTQLKNAVITVVLVPLVILKQGTWNFLRLSISHIFYYGDAITLRNA